MVGIGAVVVRAHKARNVCRAAGRIAEVVADECGSSRSTARVRRVQLRVPGVLGEPDIVPEWREGGTVELHTGVDAVVGGNIRVGLVKGEASANSLGSSGRGTIQAAIVEGHTYCPTGGDRQVRLELIDMRRVIVDLNG